MYVAGQGKEVGRCMQASTCTTLHEKRGQRNKGKRGEAKGRGMGAKQRSATSVLCDEAAMQADACQVT